MVHLLLKCYLGCPDLLVTQGFGKLATSSSLGRRESRERSGPSVHEQINSDVFPQKGIRSNQLARFVPYRQLVTA